MSRKTITEYEVIDHGIDGASYFQGCGLAFTTFTDIATGAGDTFNEALDEALEQLAWQDWDVDGANLDSERVSDEQNETISASDIVRDACECVDCENKDGVIDCQGECDCAENSETYYYVSVRVK